MKKILLFLFFSVTILGQIHRNPTAGSGDVSKVGTPVNEQVGFWTGDGTLAGSVNLVWNDDSLVVGGDLSVSAEIYVGGSVDVDNNITLGGTVDGVDIATDVGANSAFTSTPSTVITAGTNLSWSGNTLNASGGGGTNYDHQYYVEEWGMVGDGVTNDYVAFREMADSITVRGGIAKIVFESGKSYYMLPFQNSDSLMQILSATNIEIVGNNATLLMNKFEFNLTTSAIWTGTRSTGFLSGQNGSSELNDSALIGALLTEDIIKDNTYFDVKHHSEWAFLEKNDMLLPTANFSVADEQFVSNLDVGVALTYDWIGSPIVENVAQDSVFEEGVDYEFESNADFSDMKIVVLSGADMKDATTYIISYTVINSQYSGVFVFDYLDTTASRAYFQAPFRRTIPDEYAKHWRYVPSSQKFAVVENLNIKNGALRVTGFQDAVIENVAFEMDSVTYSWMNYTGTITGAVGTTSIVVTLNSVHPYQVDDRITIASVEGMTDLNGIRTITAIAPTTFTVTIPVTAQTYTSGGTAIGENGNYHAAQALYTTWNNKTTVLNHKSNSYLITGHGYGIVVGMGVKAYIDNADIIDCRHGVTTTLPSSGGILLEHTLITNSDFKATAKGHEIITSNITAWDTHFGSDLMELVNCTADNADEFAELRSNNLKMTNCSSINTTTPVSVSLAGEPHRIELTDCTFENMGYTLLIESGSDSNSIFLNNVKTIGNDASALGIISINGGSTNIIDSLVVDNCNFGIGNTFDSVPPYQTALIYADVSTDLPVKNLVLKNSTLGMGVFRSGTSTGATSSFIENAYIYNTTIKAKTFLGTNSTTTITAGTEWEFNNVHFKVPTATSGALFEKMAVEKLSIINSDFINSLSQLSNQDVRCYLSEFHFENNVVINPSSNFGRPFIEFPSIDNSYISHNSITGAWVNNGLVWIDTGYVEMNFNEIDITSTGSPSGSFLLDADSAKFAHNDVRLNGSCDSLMKVSSGSSLKSYNNAWNIIHGVAGETIFGVQASGTLYLVGDVFDLSGRTDHTIITLASGSIYKYGPWYYHNSSAPVTDNGATVTTFTTWAP